MKNFERVASVVTLMLFWCVLRPASVNAQESESPPIVVGVSINASGTPVVYESWPLLVSVIIMNENAYQSNVLPVNLTPAWENSLHFVVKNAEGNIISWPVHLVPTANEDITLDSIIYAQIGYWLEPDETNQIPPGEYELTAILDFSAYESLGSNVLSAKSGSLTLAVSNEPGSLTPEQKTDKDILFANLNLIKGDDTKALEYLSGNFWDIIQPIFGRIL